MIGNCCEPYFAVSAQVSDQAYVRHQAIRPLQLPRAEGGNPPLVYVLEPPELPRGLTFDAESRTLSGTPAELWEEAVYSYRAQDEDGDRTEPLTFRLRVDHPVPGKPAGLEALPGNMQATLRWLDPGDATITGYEVRYEGNGQRQDWRRIPGSDASTVSHRISSLRNGVAYAFRLRATSAAGKGLPSDPVRATPEAPKAEARVVKHALANLAGVLAESSTQAIKRRFQGGLLPSQFTFGGYRLFDRGFDPQTQAGAPWEAYLPAGTWKEQFSGPFDPALEPWLQARHRLGMDARTLLGSSSFMLTGTRKPGETSSDGARRFWSLWGLGVITDVSGSPMDGSFQGQVRTGYLGFDVQTGRRWLLGAALAHSQGRLDYRFDEQEGVLETALTILYPYLHLTLPRGSDLWAILGIGQGRVSNQGSSSGRQRVTNDLSLWSLALGGARPLGRVGDLSLTLQGDAGATSLKTGHDPFNSPINDVRTRTWHLRGGLEATTRLRPLGWLSLEPFLNVSLRQDGGDGLQGGGLEIGGGFRTSALEDRLRIEAHARWLALHAASGASQWEAGLLVQLAPGNDGKGLSLSLRPGYGPDSFPGTGMNLSTGSGMNPGGGHEGNFSAGLEGGSNPYLEQASRNALQLDAEIGWGFGRLLNALPGRLRLFAQTRLSEEDPFRLRGGLAYSTEQANGMNLEVFGEHEDGREPTPPDSRVGLQVNIRH